MPINYLLINKPPGPTSHDIVDKVRKITGEKRVGHAGTLDPFAEGLLVILVGREATKKQSEFMKLDKEYTSTFHLGAETDTDDKDGNFSRFARSGGARQFSIFNFQKTEMDKIPDKKQISSVLKKFTGEIEQTPPNFSAIKIKGKKAYEFARRGEAVNLKPRKVKIYGIEILEFEWPLLKLKISCSSGTYIRALARDIGRELGCGAYVEKLVRTKIGPYSLRQALSLTEVAKKLK